MDIFRQNIDTENFDRQLVLSVGDPLSPEGDLRKPVEMNPGFKPENYRLVVKDITDNGLASPSKRVSSSTGPEASETVQAAMQLKAFGHCGLIGPEAAEHMGARGLEDDGSWSLAARRQILADRADNLRQMAAIREELAGVVAGMKQELAERSPKPKAERESFPIHQLSSDALQTRLQQRLERRASADPKVRPLPDVAEDAVDPDAPQGPAGP